MEEAVDINGGILQQRLETRQQQLAAIFLHQHEKRTLIYKLRAFKRWHDVYPLEMQCRELTRQLQERTQMLETVRAAYMKDVVSIKSQLRHLSKLTREEPNHISRGNVEEALSDLHTLPSVELKTLIDRADAALKEDGTSKAMRDCLIDAGLIDPESLRPINPWEQSRAYKRLQRIEKGPSYQYPDTKGYSLQLNRPTSYKLFVRYCSECVGTIQFVRAWNYEVENNLRFRAEYNQIDNRIQEMQRVINSLQDSIIVKETKIEELEAQCVELQGANAWFDKWTIAKQEEARLAAGVEKSRQTSAQLLMQQADMETTIWNLQQRQFTRVHDLQGQVRTLQQQLKHDTKERDFETQTRLKIAQDLQAALQAKSSLQRALDAATGQKNQETAKQELLTNQLQQMERERLLAEQEHSAAEKQHAEYKKRTDNQIRELQQEVQILSKSNDQQQDEIDALKTDNRQRKVENAKYAVEMAQLQEENARLQRVVQTQSAALIAAKQQNRASSPVAQSKPVVVTPPPPVATVPPQLTPLMRFRAIAFAIRAFLRLNRCYATQKAVVLTRDQHLGHRLLSVWNYQKVKRLKMQLYGQRQQLDDWANREVQWGEERLLFHNQLQERDEQLARMRNDVKLLTSKFDLLTKENVELGRDKARLSAELVSRITSKHANSSWPVVRRALIYGKLQSKWTDMLKVCIVKCRRYLAVHGTYVVNSAMEGSTTIRRNSGTFEGLNSFESQPSDSTSSSSSTAAQQTYIWQRARQQVLFNLRHPDQPIAHSMETALTKLNADTQKYRLMPHPPATRVNRALRLQQWLLRGNDSFLEEQNQRQHSISRSPSPSGNKLNNSSDSLVDFDQMTDSVALSHRPMQKLRDTFCRQDKLIEKLCSVTLNEMSRMEVFVRDLQRQRAELIARVAAVEDERDKYLNALKNQPTAQVIQSSGANSVLVERRAKLRHMKSSFLHLLQSPVDDEPPIALARGPSVGLIDPGDDNVLPNESIANSSPMRQGTLEGTSSSRQQTPLHSNSNSIASHHGSTGDMSVYLSKVLEALDDVQQQTDGDASQRSSPSRHSSKLRRSVNTITRNNSLLALHAQAHRQNSVGSVASNKSLVDTADSVSSIDTGLMGPPTYPVTSPSGGASSKRSPPRHGGTISSPSQRSLLPVVEDEEHADQTNVISSTGLRRVTSPSSRPYNQPHVSINSNNSSYSSALTGSSHPSSTDSTSSAQPHHKTVDQEVIIPADDDAIARAVAFAVAAVGGGADDPPKPGNVPITNGSPGDDKKGKSSHPRSSMTSKSTKQPQTQLQSQLQHRLPAASPQRPQPLLEHTNVVSAAFQPITSPLDDMGDDNNQFNRKTSIPLQQRLFDDEGSSVMSASAVGGMPVSDYGDQDAGAENGDVEAEYQLGDGEEYFEEADEDAEFAEEIALAKAEAQALLQRDLQTKQLVSSLRATIQDLESQYSIATQNYLASQQSLEAENTTVRDEMRILMGHFERMQKENALLKELVHDDYAHCQQQLQEQLQEQLQLQLEQQLRLMNKPIKRTKDSSTQIACVVCAIREEVLQGGREDEQGEHHHVLPITKRVSIRQKQEPQDTQNQTSSSSSGFVAKVLSVVHDPPHQQHQQTSVNGFASGAANNRPSSAQHRTSKQMPDMEVMTSPAETAMRASGTVSHHPSSSRHQFHVSIPSTHQVNTVKSTSRSPSPSSPPSRSANNPNAVALTILHNNNNSSTNNSMSRPLSAASHSSASSQVPLSQLNSPAIQKSARPTTSRQQSQQQQYSSSEGISSSERYAHDTPPTQQQQQRHLLHYAQQLLHASNHNLSSKSNSTRPRSAVSHRATVTSSVQSDAHQANLQPSVGSTQQTSATPKLIRPASATPLTNTTTSFAPLQAAEGTNASKTQHHSKSISNDPRRFSSVDPVDVREMRQTISAHSGIAGNSSSRLDSATTSTAKFRHLKQMPAPMSSASATHLLSDHPGQQEQAQMLRNTVHTAAQMQVKLQQLHR